MYPHHGDLWRQPILLLDVVVPIIGDRVSSLVREIRDVRGALLPAHDPLRVAVVAQVNGHVPPNQVRGAQYRGTTIRQCGKSLRVLMVRGAASRLC